MQRRGGELDKEKRSRNGRRNKMMTDQRKRRWSRKRKRRRIRQRKRSRNG
jgi:hypothetical protein